MISWKHENGLSLVCVSSHISLAWIFWLIRLLWLYVMLLTKLFRIWYIITSCLCEDFSCKLIAILPDQPINLIHYILYVTYTLQYGHLTIEIFYIHLPFAYAQMFAWHINAWSETNYYLSCSYNYIILCCY